MRVKAAYLALDNPELQFEHYLAAKLGMTVARLRAEMGHGEFVHWNMYYARIAQQRQLEARSKHG